MKFFTTAVAAAGALAAAGAVAAATANADAGDVAPSTHPIGTQGTVENGGVIQGWTVSDLRPSADAIPYQPRGTLWEATATDVAIQGNVTPVISNLGARSASGQTYPALFTVASVQGVNPGNLEQGQKTSGKVYFDVTGDVPNSAVYQGAGQDLLVWTPAAPSAPTGGSSGPAATGSQHTSGPAATGTKPAQPGTPAATEAIPTGTGSQGTPLPASSQGTPLPADANGTPAAASGSEVPASTGTTGTTGTSGTSTGTGTAEASTPGTPAQSETAAAAGSSGTPLPAETPGTSTTEAAGTTGTTGTTSTAGSEGTAAAGTPGAPAASGASNSTTSHRPERRSSVRPGLHYWGPGRTDSWVAWIPARYD